MHYQRLRKRGTLEPPEKHDRTKRQCKILGCPKSVWANEMCNMHYNRVRLTGVPGSPRPTTAAAGSGCTRPDGYRILGGKQGHPLASANGQVLEHRWVLYRSIGPGTHPCHWCGTPVMWEKSYPANLDGLVVDHLDFDKSNNTTANLFPSCGSCNLMRGQPR